MRWVWPPASQNGSGKVSATFSNWPNPRRLIAPRFLAGQGRREPDPLRLEHAERHGDQHVRPPQRAVAPAAAGGGEHPHPNAGGAVGDRGDPVAQVDVSARRDRPDQPVIAALGKVAEPDPGVLLVVGLRKLDPARPDAGERKDVPVVGVLELRVQPDHELHAPALVAGQAGVVQEPLGPVPLRRPRSEHLRERRALAVEPERRRKVVERLSARHDPRPAVEEHDRRGVELGARRQTGDAGLGGERRHDVALRLVDPRAAEVHRHSSDPLRVSPAADPLARLEHHAVDARMAEGVSRAEPGEPRADHDHPLGVTAQPSGNRVRAVVVAPAAARCERGRGHTPGRDRGRETRRQL